jgi:uncharacterized membrane protein
LDVSSGLACFWSCGLVVMMVEWLDILNWLLKSWFRQAKFLSSHTVQTTACCKTWILWIPFTTIQNHALDVSTGLVCFWNSDLACFWSCGLVIMMVGYLELDQNFRHPDVISNMKWTAEYQNTFTIG